jgi:hypothetical protein
MLIIIIGIIVVIIGFAIAKSNDPIRVHSGIIKLIGIGVFLVGLAIASLV